MHKLTRDGQRGLREVRNTGRARPDELVSFARTKVELAGVLAPVDLGGVIRSAQRHLGEGPVEYLLNCRLHVLGLIGLGTHRFQMLLRPFADMEPGPLG